MELEPGSGPRRAEPGPDAGEAGPAAARPRTIVSMGEAASVRRVFGEPITAGGRTIIPAAAVSHAYGFGGSEDGEGGGGSLSARPIAVIELGEDGVSVRHSLDVTRVVLATLALAGWIVFWAARTRRPAR